MEQKRIIRGNAVERIPERKDYGFMARLSSSGEYKMHVDTKGANIAQMGVLILLHQKIGEYLHNSVKLRNLQEFKAEEDNDGDTD